ncbi:hypothetical protein GCM10027059_45280 [Myceligenerans halotolerans]
MRGAARRGPTRLRRTAAERGVIMGRMGLWITGDPETDELLSDDPFALLTGMLLDHRIR